MSGTGPKDDKDLPDLPAEEDDEDERTIVSALTPRQGTDAGLESATPPAAEPEDDADEATVVTEPPAPGADAEEPPDTTLTNGGTRRSPLQVGMIINGNYKILEELKSGGMGRVFRGETLGNELPVAIKTVRAELADDEKYGELFRSESKVLGSLRDEAIVNYLNFQYDPVLIRWFLVMEFIPGEALSDYVRRNGGITVVQAARLFRRLAMGLGKAHERGVVHRDLSPDNVMLRNGDLTQAVLIDFGIAKSMIGESNDNRSSFAGKLKYAAPEQLGLFDGEIGPQTDVYGLGLLMAAALRGRPLLMGKSLQTAVDARRQVPELSTVPVPFRPLLTQMLQPNPAARPEGMAGVAANLPMVEGKTSSGLTTGSGGSEAEMIAPVPGLRRPPRVTRPMGGTATITTGTQTGTLAGGTQTGEAAPSEPESRGSPLPKILLGLGVLAALGAGGYFLTGGQGEAPTDAEATSESAPATPGATLAGFDLGACSYAALQSTGETADGSIALYAAASLATGPLLDAYSAAHGSTPGTVEQIVSPMQCGVLDAARTLQAASATPIRLTMEPMNDSTMRGAIVDPEDRRLWLAAVNRNGQVTPLNNFRADKVGEASTFAVPLNPTSKNFPFLIVALATPQPLVETAIAASGAEADALFAKFLREIADKGIAEQSALRLLYLEVP